MDRKQLQKLKGWLTLAEAADTLGISRQAMHKKVSQSKIPSADLRLVGDFVVVRQSWVDKEQLAA